MKTIIKIEHSDITTSRFGANLEIHVDDKTSIVFTMEALDELMRDYIEIKEEIKRTDSRIIESPRVAHNLNQLEIPFDGGGDGGPK